MILGFPLVLIGPVIGAFVGAFLGAFIFSLIEKKNFDKALQAGLGAFLTRIGVSIMKIILALIMIALFYLDILV